MRTYGLSGSGMDVDQMVKDMMKARRTSYDKIWQKKTQLEWKKADYNTMYITLRDFRNTTAFNYKMQSTLIPKKISSTGENIVSATANADAANASHSINVTQLAEGAKLTSAGSISIPSANKDSLINQFGLASSKFVITLANGTASKVIQVDPSKSVYDFVSNINNAGLGIKASYDATLDRFFINTTGSGASVEIDFSGTDTTGMDFINKTMKLAKVTEIDTIGKMSTSPVGVTDTEPLFVKFGISLEKFNLRLSNGSVTRDIEITNTDTMNSLREKINKAEVNATASYDGTSFSLKATSGSLSVAGSDQAAFDFLNTDLKLVIAQSPPNPTGKDAQFNLDGMNLNQASNTFTISGVTYNLKALGSSNIVVSADNDKAVENVKAFVESYNATLEKINGELKEEKYSSLQPLTNEQKKEMKESEIIEWDKRAKSGMLKRDAILQDTIYKLRSDISTPISGLLGKYNSLSSIGVATGDYTEGGKLYLDETKLKKALEEDPDVVSKLFSTSGDTRDKQGVAVRFYDTVKSSMDKISTVGGFSGTIDDDSKSSIAKQIMRYNTELSNMDERLKAVEDRYYKQFDAMETALNRLNQQNGWLMQQFSGG
jgi:flagellar hook-associated protein 2